jgi:two-component system chemotaxis sensor kinase CheA
MIRRVVLLPVSQIEHVGDKEYVHIDGVSTRVVRLDQLLHVSPAPSMSQMYFLLPRNVHRPVALLMTRLLDTATLSTQLDTESCQEDGVLGTTHVHGRLTLVLDIFRLVDRLEGNNQLHATPSKKRRVLLVEDTQFFRLLVKGYLEGQGHEVVTAVNGARGLEALEEEKFDLVVSDIEMPEMNGWNFAREVRQRPDLRNLPMLALSTLSSPADQARALDCGFNSYEVKLDRDRFLGAVQRLLE